MLTSREKKKSVRSVSSKERAFSSKRVMSGREQGSVGVTYSHQQRGKARPPKRKKKGYLLEGCRPYQLLQELDVRQRKRAEALHDEEEEKSNPRRIIPTILAPSGEKKVIPHPSCPRRGEKKDISSKTAPTLEGPGPYRGEKGVFP